MTTDAPLLVTCEDVAWFRDEPESARGAAAALGRRVGLGDRRTAELVLATTELATNVRKHSTDGSILLRVVRTPQVAGVELVVTDGGPGIADVPAALRDGMSTTGTLGIGLGAVTRLADVFDVHSRPGHGTLQLARFWPRPLAFPPDAEPAVGGLTRPISGEVVCGDAWGAKTDPGDAEPTEAPLRRRSPDGAVDWAALTGTAPAAAGNGQRRARPVHSATPGTEEATLVMMCDGLGHGPMAALAGQAALKAFRTGRARMPDQIIQEMHRALHGTRGVAAAVVRIEPRNGRLLFCGVGNITAALVTSQTRGNLLSHPGIVGGRPMPSLRTYEHSLPEHGALVMHSDGLNERWTPADLAGLLPHRPPTIAAGLLRLAGTRRDDASVVVAKDLW